MVHINKGILFVGIPIILSTTAVLKHSIILFICFILSHFLILSFIPIFKGRENIGMFLSVVFSSVPINIYALIILNEWDLLFGSIFILGILRCILYYTILLSIEEILMGVISQLIWRNQYKLEE